MRIVFTQKCATLQRTVGAIKMTKKWIVLQQTLHTLNKHISGGTAETVQQH